MLKRLRLHNFRTYLNAEIEFGRRHLLIGKNNSGKSNLCYALRFLGATTGQQLLEAAVSCVPGAVAELANFTSKSNRIDFGITCNLPFEQQDLDYEYDLSLEVTSVSAGPTPTFGLRVVKERLATIGGDFGTQRLLDSDGHEAQLLHEEQVGREEEPYKATTLAPADATMLSTLYELETNRRAILFRRFLRGWTYYALSPESIRWGWRDQQQADRLYVDGKHVAKALFHLKNRDERRYRRLIERASKVEENLEAINFLVAPDQGIIPFVALKNRREASWAGLSEGTLRVLALSHMIEIADAASSVPGWPPPLTLIEEPENGIYGGLLREILDDFEDCAPKAQFIFTSHAPHFIDLFESELDSVTLLRREGERTVIKRLEADKSPPAPDERLTLAEKYFAEAIE